MLKDVNYHPKTYPATWPRLVAFMFVCFGKLINIVVEAGDMLAFNAVGS